MGCLLAAELVRVRLATSQLQAFAILKYMYTFSGIYHEESSLISVLELEK